MKKLYTLIAVFGISLFSQSVSAQTTWSGAPMTFTKNINTDETQEANQDRITSNVWITRASRQGIFNAASENSYEDFASPKGTEWAFGNTSNLGSLTFDSWEDTHGSEPLDCIDQEMVLHLITDDIYIDIKFLTWSTGNGMGGGSGGGFSYSRSTQNGASVKEAISYPEISVYPNPANNEIKLSGIYTSTEYSVFNILGSEVLKGHAVSNQGISIENLIPGVYFIKLEDGPSLRFVKK
jgi:hypothetical protein